MTGQDEILDSAAAWHAASTDDAMDWDGFTRWLEADPRHRLAYDEIALADAAVVEHRDALRRAEPANDVGSRSFVRPRLAWAGSAMAAALVAVLAISPLMRDPMTAYTTLDASRTITLQDGSQVILAPHSRLETRSGDTRLALAGGAYFAVPHDPSRRLEIAAGPVTISDIGTRFDVQASAEDVRVAVAEGQVIAGAAALDRPLRIAAGQALSIDGKAGTATMRSVVPASVGGWRQAQLTFNDTALTLVVADLERYVGVHVAIPKNLRDRRFSGSLNIRDGNAAARDLAGLMGLALRADGSGYRLESAGG